MNPDPILICFAVGTEAAPFRRDPPAGVEVRVTGMGPVRARDGLLGAVQGRRFRLVLTCGFAGGLSPDLARGTVVVDGEEAEAGTWLRRLQAAGAVRGRIHCADRVAVGVEDKRRLRVETGADAVEMESGVIRRHCRELGLPSVTVRVISDAAGEALPLDFNALMAPDFRLRPARMAAAILRAPGSVAGLLRLQRHTSAAASALAGVLRRALASESGSESESGSGIG